MPGGGMANKHQESLQFRRRPVTPAQRRNQCVFKEGYFIQPAPELKVRRRIQERLELINDRRNQRRRAERAGKKDGRQTRPESRSPTQNRGNSTGVQTGSRETGKLHIRRHQDGKPEDSTGQARREAGSSQISGQAGCSNISRRKKAGSHPQGARQSGACQRSRRSIRSAKASGKESSRTEIPDKQDRGEEACRQGSGAP